MRRLVRCGIVAPREDGGPAIDQMVNTGPNPGGPVRGMVCPRTNRHHAVLERKLIDFAFLPRACVKRTLQFCHWSAPGRSAFIPCRVLLHLSHEDLKSSS